MTGHAFAVIDAFIYGFALQEATLPATGGDELTDIGQAIIEHMPADAFPYLTELATQHVMLPGYDFGTEFEFGLALILDGIETAAHAER